MILQGSVARSIAAVAVAGLVTFAAPPPAAARVIVSVELVYGSVAVGGLGIFVALAGSWEAFAAQGGIPDALIEAQGGRTRFGMPLAPLQTLPGDDVPDRPATEVLRLNLLRWRF